MVTDDKVYALHSDRVEVCPEGLTARTYCHKVSETYLCQQVAVLRYDAFKK
jgi:hypothetical protein